MPSANSEIPRNRTTNDLRSRTGWLIVVFVAAGLLIRVTVRDSIPYLAIIYYATPWPVQAAGGIISNRLLGPYIPRLWRRTFLAISLFCVAMFYTQHYEHSQQNLPVHSGEHAPVKELRVAFWNVARGLRGWSPVFNEIRQMNADVFGVVECAPLNQEMRRTLLKEFPEYHAAFFDHDMLLLSRLPIVHQQSRSNFRGVWFGTATVTLGEQDIHLVVADISSRLTMHRKAPIEELRRTSKQLSHHPTIVMGDFNTPSDSAFLDAFRSDFTNTFEAVGEGFHCTWPVPCPVMAIDQMWVSNTWHIQNCHLHWTWVSDHRPIVSTIRLQPATPDSSSPN